MKRKEAFMNRQELIQSFESVRDIPYSLPLSLQGEINNCVGKNKKLMDILKRAGYEVRWRLCSYRWSDIFLPEEVRTIPHIDEATHAYLEVNIDGDWKTVDATWDSGLKDMFMIGKWDGVSSTVVAVPCRDICPPEKSAEIMALLESGKDYADAFESDKKINGEFYKAFNHWFESIRKK